MTKLLPPGYASWTPARSCSPTSRASSCTSSMSPLPGSCAASAKAPTWARASPPRRSQSFSAWTAVRRHAHESGPRASARGEPCCDAESSSGCTGCPAAEVVDDAVDRIGDLPGPDLVDRMVGVREHDVPAAGNLGGPDLLDSRDSLGEEPVFILDHASLAPFHIARCMGVQDQFLQVRVRREASREGPEHVPDDGGEFAIRVLP